MIWKLEWFKLAIVKRSAKKKAQNTMSFKPGTALLQLLFVATDPKSISINFNEVKFYIIRTFESHNWLDPKTC